MIMMDARWKEIKHNQYLPVELQQNRTNQSKVAALCDHDMKIHVLIVVYVSSAISGTNQELRELFQVHYP